MHHHIKHRMLRHDPLPRLPGNLMPFSDRQLSGYFEMDIHQHQIPRLTVFKSCRPATPGVARSVPAIARCVSSSTARSIKSCSAVAANDSPSA